MTHDAEKHTSGLLGRPGALKRLFKFGHVPCGLFVLDDEHMEETVGDETAERGKRRERPNDLKDIGHGDSDAGQEYHHASSADGIPAAEGLPEHENRHQNIVGDQKREKQIALVSEIILALPVEIENAVVENIGRQHHDVDGQKRIPEPVESARHPFVEAEVGDEKAPPHENERDQREEEEQRINIQQGCPAKSRDYAP